MWFRNLIGGVFKDSIIPTVSDVGIERLVVRGARKIHRRNKTNAKEFEHG